MICINEKLCDFLNELSERGSLTPKIQLTYRSSYKNPNRFKFKLMELQNRGIIRLHENNGKIKGMELTLYGDVFRSMLNHIFKKKEGFWNVLHP